MKFAKLHLLQKFLMAESDKNLHRLLSTNFMPPDSLWNSEDQLNISNGIGKLPKLLPLLDDPAFLARLVFVFILVAALEPHYLSFPEVYDPATFNAWRRYTRRIFASAPKG
jgi:hypothetical protein